MEKNIILIGMPASGKSTVGVILAKELKYGFSDTDLLIQTKTDQTLTEIIDERGNEGFLKLEDEILSEIDVKGHVIATGGSAIYGKNAMENFRRNGVIVYLKAGYDTIEKRLNNIETRGVAMGKDETLKDIYYKRIPVYEKYADVTVEVDGLNVEQTVQKIIGSLK